ncbi:HNH endonuclease signature motif containing protein [Nocardioides donggukensis]|uniref:DUF222 domain-containing protein n=1 Tax=Nocardioides donggukensis TaxID=2774019 RepID=A0A927Q0F8_9ACTN|nr:HNH endonuclease signature motif containing protein [Nocardioides donggukensis]MBD8868877.1 DUF222 domain-containing protein [Nocardioides donggukensis]
MTSVQGIDPVPDPDPGLTPGSGPGAGLGAAQGVEPGVGPAGPGVGPAGPGAGPGAGAGAGLGAGHPASVVAAVHAVLDRVEVGELPVGQYAAVVGEWERALRRMEAVKLRLVAAAAGSSVAADAGCASTGAWLARTTRTGTAAAAREARLAADLDRGLPATRADLDRGGISAQHAGVIAQAVSRLPAGLDPVRVAAVEARLVDQARRVDPAQLRILARRALAAVEEDRARVDAHEDAQLGEEERAAAARSRLTLHDNDDGTLSGHFTVPLVAGTVLKKILDALTSPRRAATGESQAGPGASEAGAGVNGVGVRDWAHERGLAFAQLLETLPTDRLSSKTAATVVVTLDAETLRGQARAAGLDTGDLVSAGQARRLACQASIVPAVLGGRSQPLDLGRSRRFFSQTQRLAGATVHTSCAGHDCQVPYAWCELHHAHPWARGGRTDLADMVPLCGFHHHRIHDPDHLHQRLPDGTIRFHRRT